MSDRPEEGDDELARLEVRLRALEALVAFQFAAQHMQTSDPAAAVARLSELLMTREQPFADLPARERGLVAAELRKAIDRIAELQDELPRRLVD